MTENSHELPSLAVLLGGTTVDKAWLAERADLIMSSIGPVGSAAEIDRRVNLLASAAALGVKIREIFHWAEAMYKTAEKHCKKEAALYERTKALSLRANERYGTRPMFSLRKAKIQTITATVQARLEAKSRERAMAAYLIGITTVRMNSLNNAILLGFTRACNHPKVAKWVEDTAQELHQLSNDPLLQLAMASGLFRASKPGAPVERTARQLVNGYSHLLAKANYGSTYDGAGFGHRFVMTPPTAS